MQQGHLPVPLLVQSPQGQKVHANTGHYALGPAQRAGASGHALHLEQRGCARLPGRWNHLVSSRIENVAERPDVLPCGRNAL